MRNLNSNESNIISRPMRDIELHLRWLNEELETSFVQREEYKTLRTAPIKRIADICKTWDGPPMKICPSCNGQRWDESHHNGDTWDCRRCNENGEVLKYHMMKIPSFDSAVEQIEKLIEELTIAKNNCIELKDKLNKEN